MGNNTSVTHGGFNRERSKKSAPAHHPLVTPSDSVATQSEETTNRSTENAATRSEKYAIITRQAGEMFGLGESPLQIRDDKKPGETQQTSEDQTNDRVATVGVKYKASAEHLIPVLFRWKVPPLPARRNTGPNEARPSGRPNMVMVGGSFNNWQLVTMKESRTSFVIILELPVGEHQYKFNIDGVWMHHPKEPTTNDGVGGLNNVIRVTEADAEVFRALEVDAEETERKRSARKKFLAGPLSKDFGQDLPFSNQEELELFLKLGGPPPVLPPHLLQVILNKETPLSCEPTLLPAPNHVMVNHMYALSIKDNVIVMSTTQRFRSKCVTTIVYRPI